jgi:hypothetical protein
MAETSVAANNKPVSFGVKPMHEIAGVKKAKPMKAVRKTAKGAMKRGLISEKAAARHLKDY